MFFINHTEIGDGSTAVIEFDGPLNSESAPDFDDYISKLLDNGIIFLLLDLQNLKFISSEGIGAMLMALKSVEAKKGKAVFFNLNNEIKSLFKLLGFDRVFTTASDRADAISVIDRRMELFAEEENKPDAEESYDFDIPLDDDFLEPEPPVNGEAPIENKPVGGNPYEPFIIECVKCSSLIRVSEPGEQICPFCSSEFTVTDEKKAVFKIANNH